MLAPGTHATPPVEPELLPVLPEVEPVPLDEDDEALLLEDDDVPVLLDDAVPLLEDDDVPVLPDDALLREDDDVPVLPADDALEDAVPVDPRSQAHELKCVPSPLHTCAPLRPSTHAQVTLTPGTQPAAPVEPVEPAKRLERPHAASDTSVKLRTVAFKKGIKDP